MGRECVLCGDYEADHEETRPGDRFLGRCRQRNYYGPGRNDFVRCDCPGFEADPETEGTTCQAR